MFFLLKIRMHKRLSPHGDFEHMGDAINLVNNYKVEKVIFNCGPYNDLEKELIKVLDKKKIKYYSCIKELNIDNNKLYFLQTKEYDNQNLEQENKSLIYRLNYLFDLLKKFLRKLLQRGNDYTKDETANVVKDCYDNSEFDMGDVIKKSKGTTKL